MKTREKKMNCPPTKLIRRINATCLCIEWFFFTIFCFIAGYFMKDVFEQFQAKETFMAESLKPITKYPTIVMCFHYPVDVKENLNISYRSRSNGITTLLQANQPNIFPEEKETVVLEQINHKCIKINSTSAKSSARRDIYKEIVIDTQKIPSNIEVYFSSERNSYGIFYHQWFDGKVTKNTMSINRTVEFVIKPIEHKYLNQDSQCSDLSFLEQFKYQLEKINVSECAKPCFSDIFMTSSKLPLCEWNSTFNEWKDSCKVGILDIYRPFRGGDFKRPCHVLEYEVEKTFDKGYKETTLYYSFAQPEMVVEYKERLVFDVIGMVGSIGGTLGMCIGFSFSGILSTIIEFIRTRILANL